jgi:hypothetical protein
VQPGIRAFIGINDHIPSSPNLWEIQAFDKLGLHSTLFCFCFHAFKLRPECRHLRMKLEQVSAHIRVHLLRQLQDLLLQIEHGLIIDDFVVNVLLLNAIELSQEFGMAVTT